MNKNLISVQELAIKNPEIKKRFIETKSSKEPLDSFCKLCCELGFPISIGELLADGEEFCSAMLRSVNGGGVETPDDLWQDSYSLFFAAIEM